MTQIERMLPLAPEIQDETQDLPLVNRGRDTTQRHLRRIVVEVD